MRICLAPLLLLLLDCEAFWWGYDPPDLCQESCRCLSNLQQGLGATVDCRDANLTQLQDDLAFPAGFSGLDFSRNNIESLSSSTFRSSASILDLDLSDNDLKNLPLGVFQPLARLRSLALKNNEIRKVDKQAFSGLFNLTKLDLSYNKIENLPSAVLEPLKNLQDLNLGFNPMSKLNWTLLLHNSALKTLDLSSVGLRTIHPIIAFANLTRLEKLSLAHNHLTVVPSKALFFLRSSLIDLDLSANPIKSLGAYSFYGLSNLRTLILEQMLRLETVDSFAFGDLSHLERIVLRYLPRIESVDPKAFHGSVNGKEVPMAVEDFTLSFSILSTLPEELLPWERLRYASLEYNRWNCDCQMKWIKTSPLLEKLDNRMLCAQPPELRGHRLQNLKEEDLTCRASTPRNTPSVGLLVALIVIGVAASLGTVAVLAYRRQGWLFRPRGDAMYSGIERGATTITVSDQMEWDNEDLQAD